MTGRQTQCNKELRANISSRGFQRVNLTSYPGLELRELRTSNGVRLGNDWDDVDLKNTRQNHWKRLSDTRTRYDCMLTLTFLSNSFIHTRSRDFILQDHITQDATSKK